MEVAIGTRYRYHVSTCRCRKAQDTANHKRRVFVVQPEPPYDIGDLWTQGSNGDLMRCRVARASGSYSVDDWEKASKYTDDSSLDLFINGVLKIHLIL